MWESEIFGGEYANFWHGEGVWCPDWETCNAITKSNQQRKQAFGCQNAPVPDVYPPDVLIFLPNNGPASEWGAIRQAMHNYFLDMGLPTYQQRIRELPSKIASEWPQATKVEMVKADLKERFVCKCLFHVFFGVWVDDKDADVLRGWKKLAPVFIIPRIGQRFVFNLGIKKVQKLRIDTVGIIEKHGLQELFHKMNNGLPPQFKRTPVVKLCDEITFAMGFAGIGGTANLRTPFPSS
jgi:hypothetical protein